MKQPEIEKGKTFTGWATFNWGICHNQVFRTRKQAQDACCDFGHTTKYGKTPPTWNDVKDHFKVVKVKCTVV